MYRSVERGEHVCFCERIEIGLRGRGRGDPVPTKDFVAVGHARREQTRNEEHGHRRATGAREGM